MTVIIYLLLFKKVDKIFIEFIIHFSNHCKIELIICSNVSFFNEIFENWIVEHCEQSLIKFHLF